MLLRNSLGLLRISVTRMSRSLSPLSRGFTYRQKSHSGVLQPRRQRRRFGLVRFRSPLLTESNSLSVPLLTKMFQFSRSCVSFPILFRKERLHITGARLPHSEISGSKRICRYPKLIAAYHVLHRLLAPRHPLCALYSLFPSLHLKLVCTVQGRRWLQTYLVCFTPFVLRRSFYH